MEDTTDRPSSNLSLRADEIVTDVLEKVLISLSRTQNQENQEDQENLPEYQMKNIDWVTCQNFTVEVGKKQIEDYIHTWEMHPSWLFSVHFLRERQLQFSRQYLYQARWSFPTPRTPIPQATASVYFIIETSQIKPQSLPVEVHFITESTTLVHQPGRCRFREKWLKDVIESKILLRNTVHF